MKLTELYEKREVRAGELTLLDRKCMEIARALGTQSKLLLLDEVAAGIMEAEGHQLLTGDPLMVMNSKVVEEVYLGVEEEDE